MVEKERDSLVVMSRQEVIDLLSGNRRRVIQRGGQFSTVIERIDRPTDSGEGTYLFTPPEVLPEPQA